MGYSTIIDFAPGLYPSKPIVSSSVNLLIDNVNMIDKQQLVLLTTAAPTTITQATSGTWSNVGAALVDPSGNVPAITQRPFIVQFEASLVASAAVANKVLFAWFDNGVQVGGIAAKYTTDITGPHAILIMKYITSFSNSFVLKWQVEAGTPNVTMSMPSGYRILAWPI